MKALFYAMALLGVVMTTTNSVVLAQTGTIIDVGNPTAGEGYSVENGVITIASSGEYTLQGSTASNRVVVAQEVVATVTLDGVSIISATASPLELSGGGEGNDAGANVTLRLVGNNRFSCTKQYSDTITEAGAGVQVEGAGTTLTIDGEGSLTANGGTCGAGIGGRLITGQVRGGNPGKIIIKGGIITATGGGQAAGIGGGAECDGGTIIINGGVVTANGEALAAGIGGGYHGAGGAITINGGIVTAVGGNGGAGIGSGYGSTSGNITITGGSVFAYSPFDARGEAAGIGGSLDGDVGGNINISGGTIVAGKIGISTSIATPTTVAGGVIITNKINTTAFGTASVTTGANITEAMVRTLAAVIPQPDTLTRHDTLILTQNLHDTLIRELHDTLALPDIVYIHDTLGHDTVIDTIILIRRDTVRFPQNIYIRDTTRLTRHDTIVEVREIRETFVYEIRDTTFREVYVVVDNSTGVERIVEEDPDYIVLDATDGSGRCYFYGLRANAPLAVYDLSGALILRADRMPVPLTTRGVLIVGQDGRYRKFVR